MPIQLSGYSAWIINRFLNIKNVLCGFRIKRNISVDVKQLVYEIELNQLDQHHRIGPCAQAGQGGSNVSDCRRSDHDHYGSGMIDLK